MPKSFVSLIVLFLYTTDIPAQSIQIEGLITDSLENPLVNTKVIASPLLEANAQIKFSISSSKGEYRLRLESNQPFLIEVKPQCSKKKKSSEHFN